MKKQILLFAALAITAMAIAQQKFTGGIRAGATISRLEGDAMKSLSSLLEYTDGMVTTATRKGVFAGANVNIPLSSLMSVEPGLYYSQKGMELRGAIDIKGVEFLGANAKARLNTHYVDLPVVLKADINGFQIFAGPQLSYLARADLRATAGVLGFNLLDRKWDATEQMNRWDAGLTGGIGYRFNNINISASYDHGLMKSDANENLDAYNRSFKIGVGMNF